MGDRRIPQLNEADAPILLEQMKAAPVAERIAAVRFYDDGERRNYMVIVCLADDGAVVARTRPLGREEVARAIAGLQSSAVSIFDMGI